MNQKRFTFFLFIVACLQSESLFSQQKDWVLSSPAGDAPTQIERGGRTILPNGRIVTPLGRQLETAPHPYGLAVSADGRWAVTANSGIAPFSISIIENPFSEKPSVRQIPDGARNDEGVLEACFMGLAISPDSKTVFVAGGEANKIFLFDLETGKKAGEINCAVKTKEADYRHGYLGDVVLSRDGRTLFVVDQIGFRLVVVDVLTQKLKWNVPTGRYPFGVCLSPDEQRIYVANVGVFEYKRFTDLDEKDLKRTAHAWPATDFGSKKMRDGDDDEGLPPLGDANDPAAFSVWSYNMVSNDTPPQISKKIKTGFLVGQMVEDFPAVGGSSPNSLAATDDFVFVSNATNDCVSVIDLKKDTVVATIFLQPDARLGSLRGVIPFGLAVSPDQKRLFVAESGLNAVAVVDITTKKVLGHLPVGWFPAKLKTSPDGQKLLVSNAKGYGSGPNGGSTFTLREEGSYIGNLMKGTLSVVDLSDDYLKNEADFFEKQTARVVENNFVFSEKRRLPKAVGPIPSFAGQKDCPIKYWVFVAKENRTYDEMFGQKLGGAGEAALARFGEKQSFSNRKGKKRLENVDVAPNHLALARRFSIGDNYFCDSDVSADGHRWLVNTYPNEWVETETAAHYGGKKDLRDDSAAPGNLATVGSAGSIYPEDYNEAGSMWEHLERHGVDYFNYGFGVEMAGSVADSTMKTAGERYTINYPLPGELREHSSRTFPTYNLAIPDQYRADVFMKDYREKWLDAGKNPPPVLTLMLPNDHTGGERPWAGYPFQQSYVADNDLALGRVVEFLSRTPQWKNMAIVITEDDPQGGVDHVDAHRSVLMVISPWAKRDFVGHQHYSFGSIFKTIWNGLGIPCLNQYDAGAQDLGDLFTEKPDFEPFNAVPIDPRLFDPKLALTPLDEKFDWKALGESPRLDWVPDMQRQSREADEKRTKKHKKRKKH